MNKKIIFSSGGTGGHIFPAINLMKHFSYKGHKVLLVTDDRGNNFLKDYPELKSCIIKSSSPINKNFFQKILSLITIFNSLIKSMIILKKEKPHLIFGLGGYVSFPISFASKFFGVPLVIYENNAVLGRANKYLLSVAKKILLAKEIEKNLPKKFERKAYQVGTILSKDIINFSISKKKHINNNLSILVLGGSQGAEIFGKIITPAIKMLKEKGYEIEINQQCIKKQKETLVSFYKENKIKNNVFEFKKNILDFILSSDFAISRCGASSMAELAQTFTPFIGVPIPNSIDNHQFLNAKYYEKKGYCWLLEQNNFNSENLFKLILDIIIDKKKLKEVQETMKKINSNNVYNNIENQIREFI